MTLKLLSLTYHDVVEEGEERDSGFFTESRNRYKVKACDFREHLRRFQESKKTSPKLADSDPANWSEDTPWALTFDDGGTSAYTVIAKELASFGYKAHFFITTSLIGQPHFMTKEQIIELKQMGHLIGSHTHTHPRHFHKLPYETIQEEWKRSIEILSEIIGEPVTVGSVPGGYYGKKVAEAASQAGLKFLFTSDPVQKAYKVNNCWVLGRYCILRSTPAKQCLDLVLRKPVPCLKQYVWGVAKKAGKSVLGNRYLVVRKWILRFLDLISHE